MLQKHWRWQLHQRTHWRCRRNAAEVTFVFVRLKVVAAFDLLDGLWPLRIQVALLAKGGCTLLASGCRRFNG